VWVTIRELQIEKASKFKDKALGAFFYLLNSSIPFCYNNVMQTKVLIVGVVKKDGAILMRKKPDGSPPYKETWYIFGAEATAYKDPDQAIIEEVQKKSGITVAIRNKISWDTEIKNDLDGVQKFFIYLDVECEYVAGDVQVGEGIEKIEWVSQENLASYDIVPPSRILFKKLGYLA
jgi:hypothetical protein